MRVLAAVTLLAATVGIVGANAHADAQATKLVGLVDDTATISLKNEGGTPVTTIPPATYDVEVTDSSYGHNFHLYGPGVDRRPRRHRRPRRPPRRPRRRLRA